MIITLEEVKQHLRLEKDYIEEDIYLQMLIESAEEYLKNATGKTFNSTNALAKLALLIWICDRYENRGSQDLTIKAQNALSYIVLQLQYCYIEVTM